MRQGIS